MTHWNDLSEQAKKIYNISSNPNNYSYTILDEIKKFEAEIRADERAKTIDDCIAILLNIMPSEPFLLKSKHYENWKMKTRELRMLRDMFEQMKGETE